ncbi:MAG: DegV family protein [Desulfobacterales bacterium]
MDSEIRTALEGGYTRMAAWSDLLDEINVFPVADGDTGRNLRVSLAPLINPENPNDIGRILVQSATGNSGNIAAAFLSRFAAAETPRKLPEAARAGSLAAWQALAAPKSGTMLTVFDALAQELNTAGNGIDGRAVDAMVDRMIDVVLATSEALPVLKSAGVLDAGALGMFLFFEGFLRHLAGQPGHFRPIRSVFGGRLSVSEDFDADTDEAYCVDMVLRPTGDREATAARLTEIGTSVVAVPHVDDLKIHLHTPTVGKTREQLSSLGTITRWRQERITRGQAKVNRTGHANAGVHVVTDAAGSLSRETAADLGISLLDSYIVMDGRSVPESLVSPEDLYRNLRGGMRITTAQASLIERRQAYESLVSRFDSVLYLCVGSVYTGNYDTARQWVAENTAERSMAVVDTTAASGRLGLLAMDVARFARTGQSLKFVADYARAGIGRSEELVFIGQLKYLAASGRLSKSKGFFGDLLGIKPVVTPTARGAEKVASLRTAEDQIEFALDRLGQRLTPDFEAEVMLQYTDNRDWVRSRIKPILLDRLPRVAVIDQPMSLTSGVHMGPGTWAVAWLNPDSTP